MSECCEGCGRETSAKSGFCRRCLGHYHPFERYGKGRWFVGAREWLTADALEDRYDDESGPDSCCKDDYRDRW